MRGNDLSNRTSGVVYIRMENFLFVPKKEGSFLSKIAERIFGVSKWELNPEVASLANFIFRTTDMTVRFVCMSENEREMREAMEPNADYWDIVSFHHISAIEYLLKFGEVYYYVDNPEVIDTILHPCAVTLPEAFRIFKGVI